MVEKLRLPFPYLSDPDRSLAIEPYDLADPDNPRQIARPATVLLDSEGVERWRFVSRDFAERLPEDEVIEQARALGLRPVEAWLVETVGAEPGPRAMPLSAMSTYFRGAKFAALAMGRRHRHFDEAIADDSKAFVAEMERFIEAVSNLRGE